MQPFDASSLIAKWLPDVQMTSPPSLRVRVMVQAMCRRPSPTAEQLTQLRRLLRIREGKENDYDAVAHRKMVGRCPNKSDEGEVRELEAYYGIK